MSEAMRIFLILFLLSITSFSNASCFKHSARHSGSSIEVAVTNQCGETANINVCINVGGEKRRVAHRVQNNGNWTFSFINWNDSSYDYKVKGCRPGGTTRADTCPAECPGSSGQDAAIGTNAGSSSSSEFLTEGLYGNNISHSQSCADAVKMRLRRIDSDHYQLKYIGETSGFDIRLQGGKWFMHGLAFSEGKGLQVVPGKGRNIRVPEGSSYTGDHYIYCGE